MSEIKRNYPGRLLQNTMDEKGLPYYAEHVYNRPRQQEPYILDNFGDDLEETAEHLVGRAAKATEKWDNARLKERFFKVEGNERVAKALGDVAWRSVWTEDELKEVDNTFEEVFESKDAMDIAMWRAFEHYRNNSSAYHQAALEEDIDRENAKNGLPTKEDLRSERAGIAARERIAMRAFDAVSGAEALTKEAAGVDPYDPVKDMEEVARKAAEAKKD